MWTLAFVTAGCMVAGPLLLGLPGALLMQLVNPLLVRLHGKGQNDLGDRAWPAAVLVSLGWPLAVPPAWLWMRTLTESSPLRWAGTAGLCLAWGCLLAVVIARPAKDA